MAQKTVNTSKEIEALVHLTEALKELGVEGLTFQQGVNALMVLKKAINLDPTFEDIRISKWSEEK